MQLVQVTSKVIERGSKTKKLCKTLKLATSLVMILYVYQLIPLLLVIGKTFLSPAKRPRSSAHPVVRPRGSTGVVGPPVSQQWQVVAQLQPPSLIIQTRLIFDAVEFPRCSTCLTRRKGRPFRKAAWKQ